MNQGDPAVAGYGLPCSERLGTLHLLPRHPNRQLAGAALWKARDLHDHSIDIRCRLCALLVELQPRKPLSDVRPHTALCLRHWRTVYHHDVDDRRYLRLRRTGNGARREGLFGAIYWWMVKFGLAFAGLLSGFILGVIGFDQSVAIQTESTLAQLRLAFIGVPVTGTLIALWAMRGYTLDEQAVGEIKEALAQRRTTSTPDRDEIASQREEEWALQP